MRTLVRIVLLVFVFFLSAPTIVSVIKRSCDTSCVWSMSEEELAHKEVKAELRCHYHFEPPIVIQENAGPIIEAPQAIADSFSARILIPPPEQV